MRTLASLTYLRAGTISLVTLLVVLAAAPFAAGVFERTEPFDISDPDSEVERAYASYEEAVGVDSEPEVLLLVEPGAGAGRSAPIPATAAAAERLKSIGGIGTVERAPRRSELVSADGAAALVVGFLEAGANRVTAGEAVAEAFADDPQVTAGGISVAAYQIGEQTEEDTRRIELYAAPFLLLLLLAVFRSAVAAALPLALGAVSILLTFAALSGLATVMDIDLFSLQVVTGLGVGLAIDYSLFIIARYRSELRAGRGYEEAQRRTMATAGRTVAFSALTVAAALAALVIFPNQFLRSTGVAGGLVALLSGGAALVVLPALLALLGARVDPGFAGSSDEDDPPPEPLGGGSDFWRGLAARIGRHPLPVAAVTLTAMVAIGLPGLGGRLTTPDAGSLPAGESARQVADAATERFPQLPATRLSVVIPVDGAGTEEARARVLGLPDVVEVTEPAPLDPQRALSVVAATVDPLSEEGQELVAEVRAAPWPEGTLIGGRAAELADQQQSIEAHAIAVVALIVATNLLLVFLTVRSVVLPLVAILLNALTVFAAYGLMVFLFETDATAELLGAGRQTGIDISVPILAFAVVFGLSTDYGIFLFSRIAEARRGGLDPGAAIAEGLSRTGRLITSAAVIFAVAVGAFAFSDLVIVKEFAVAVSIAVLLNATLVRGLLVPAVLTMLGGRAWRGLGGVRLGEG